MRRRIGATRESVFAAVAALSVPGCEKAAPVAFGRHRHECEACGAIWEHANRIKWADDEVNAKAHECPACGETNQRWVYRGDSAPEFHDHHLGADNASAERDSSSVGAGERRSGV